MMVKTPREKTTMRIALRFIGSFDLPIIEVGISMIKTSDEILKDI